MKMPHCWESRVTAQIGLNEGSWFEPTGGIFYSLPSGVVFGLPLQTTWTQIRYDKTLGLNCFLAACHSGGTCISDFFNVDFKKKNSAYVKKHEQLLSMQRDNN